MIAKIELWQLLLSSSCYTYSSVTYVLRWRHGRCAARRLLNRFCEKPYFWISCMIFRYYPLTHFHTHFWNQNLWKKFLDTKKFHFRSPIFRFSSELNRVIFKNINVISPAYLTICSAFKLAKNVFRTIWPYHIWYMVTFIASQRMPWICFAKNKKITQKSLVSTIFSKREMVI